MGLWYDQSDDLGVHVVHVVLVVLAFVRVMPVELAIRHPAPASVLHGVLRANEGDVEQRQRGDEQHAEGGRGRSGHEGEPERGGRGQGARYGGDAARGGGHSGGGGGRVAGV